MLNFDKSQQEFLENPYDSIRLLAPAGSGKTTSLLWRCLEIHKKAREADTFKRFLVFTFTRGARDELRERLRTVPDFSEVRQFVNIVTLNSFGFRLVKESFNNPRLITGAQDKYTCIHNSLRPVWMRHPHIKDLMEDKRRQVKAGQELLSLIDLMKSMGFRHDKLDSYSDFVQHFEYLERCQLSSYFSRLIRSLADLGLIPDKDDKSALVEVFQNFVPFWKEACENLIGTAQLSLEDQKYLAWIKVDGLLEAGKYSLGAAKYHYIFVDEFQDINPLDLLFLHSLQKFNKAKLCIVGDDDQAIYEWRGATPNFILNPNQFLGESYETCILSTNYRSPSNIVLLSQKLISHNARRVKKEVRSHRQENAEVQILKHSSVADSINATTALVKTLLASNPDESIALIGRKRSQIIPYQIVFAGDDMPFYAAEDLHILLSDAFRELKDILAIRAKALAMSGTLLFDYDPVQDLLKLCDKVKRYPLAKAEREHLRKYLYSSKPKDLLSAVGMLRRYDGPLKGSNEGGKMAESFAKAITSLISAKSISESILAISNDFDGLKKDYGKAIEDIFYTDPPFLYLSEFAKHYGSNYSAFYDHVEKAITTLARIPAEVDDDDVQDENRKLPLHLMTSLRAKGKEFDTVIVLDANEGIWPSKLAQTDNELEQERRLFYVAITRPRKRLYFVINESINGEGVVPTPYLSEMGVAMD